MKVLRSSFILLLVTLLMLMGFEGVARVLGWRAPSLPSLPTGFGYSATGLGDLTPNLDSIETLLPMRPYRLVTNGLGLRNLQDPDPDPSVVRLLAVGDSFMYGYYVHNEETTPARLEETLNQRWGTRYQVFNAGVPGYTAADVLSYLQDKGLQLQPSAVVMSFYSNDVFDYLPEMRQFFARQTLLARPVPALPAQSGLGAWLRGNSALYNGLLDLRGRLDEAQLQAQLANITPQVSGLEETYRQMMFLDVDNPQYADAYSAYARDLDAIADLLRAQGIPLLLVAYPDLMQVPEDNGIGTAPQDFLARLTDELGIAYLDLLPVYRAAGDVQSLYLMYYRDKTIDYGKPDFATMAYYGDGHPSMYGHLVAARAIADTLAELSFIPR